MVLCKFSRNEQRKVCGVLTIFISAIVVTEECPYSLTHPVLKFYVDIRSVDIVVQSTQGQDRPLYTREGLPARRLCAVIIRLGRGPISN